MKKIISFFALSLLIGGFAASSFAQTDTVFKPHGQIVGQLFSDYYYQLSADTVNFKTKAYYEPNANISPSWGTKFFQAFDIRRAQLGYNYWFSANTVGKFLLEHESGAANGDVLPDAKRSVYVKEASIGFSNLVPMATLIFGQQATNVFSVDEALMGYRSIEKSIVDMRGMSEAGSNDLGIQLVGNFDKDKNFGYSALISNGAGSKDATVKYKDFTGEVNAKFMDKHIVIDVAADYMDKPTVPLIIIGKDTAGEAKLVDQSNTLIKASAAYTSTPVTVGVVYAMHTLKGQSKSVAGADADQSGLSIFARGQIIEKQLFAFARYDMFDPDTKASDNSSGPKENFIVAGLDWVPDVDAPNAHVMPNIWINTFKDKSSVGQDFEGITDLRLTFAYKF